MPLPRHIGLVVATRFEAAALLRTFTFEKSEKGLYLWNRGDRGTVWLMISGMGLEPARQAAYRLCALGAKELVSVGFCGALSKDLQVGDLVTDRIATSRIPVWGQTERLALAERANAQAVDMETQAIIEAGTRKGVPIRVLRVVSDRLGDDVSPLLGKDPTFSPVKIALRLLNPSHWPYAYRLWRQSRLAKTRMIAAVERYLNDPESP
jgi:nucleoside phosphorylase